MTEPLLSIEGFTNKGPFLVRKGPAFKDGASFCKNKLCLVSTDKTFLAQTLYDLSLRPDCYFVKLTHTPRDGMFLGRCFLMTPDAVGHLWARLKPHPKLMCTVQDDEFTERFRPKD